MPHGSSVPRRFLLVLGVAVLAATGLIPARPALAAAPGHTALVSETPAVKTPDVQDEEVNAIYDAGATILAGGLFTRVQNHGEDVDYARNFLFAFDQASGKVSTAFAPTVDGEVTQIIGGPTAATVYISGRFGKVNGIAAPKLALLNLADGSLVSTFKPPAFNDVVQDIALVGGRLLVVGNFTLVGSTARKRMASVNATTGALDSYLTVALDGHHNYDGTTATANSPIGVNRMSVSNDGKQLVAVGNFKTANGVVHDQIVKLDLGASAATIANWNTTRLQAACYAKGFDSYVRDVAFSPDGKFFAVASTGHMYKGALCDAAARFEAANTGATQQPTWIAYTGGDTVLSVAISETAVYIGGHFRWLNNSFATNSARPGAVGRATIAALDPANGLPLDWNPGRHPRGYGVTRLYLTPEGLWLGSDTDWIGNYTLRRQKIAFFPLAGGAVRPSAATKALPGKVYRLGANPPTTVLYRVNAGGPAIAAADGGPNWVADTAATSTLHNTGLAAVSGRDIIEKVQTPPWQPQFQRSIFSSERAGTAAAQHQYWTIPIPKGTSIQVRLFFASRCECTVGTRKMGIYIDTIKKLSVYDVVAEVGNHVGTMKAWNVVSDGTVNITVAKEGTLYPILGGIEIVKTAAATPTGQENKLWAQSYDGAASVGTKSELTGDGTTWSAGRGGFWVGGNLYYALHDKFYKRGFDGSTFGQPTEVDPYHDTYWDTVKADGNGPVDQTYAGYASNFYWELSSVSAMFYAGGRLYYTIAGEAPLYYRYFSPDTGVVGADRFTVAGTSAFADAGGLFVSGSKLYLVSRSTGKLSTYAWSGTAPSGAATVVSSADWRGKVVFVGP